jgi:hypothetical protein
MILSQCFHLGPSMLFKGKTSLIACMSLRFRRMLVQALQITTSVDQLVVLIRLLQLSSKKCCLNKFKAHTQAQAVTTLLIIYLKNNQMQCSVRHQEIRI